MAKGPTLSSLLFSEALERDSWPVLAEDFSQDSANLPERRCGIDAIENRLHEIDFSASCRFLKRFERTRAQPLALRRFLKFAQPRRLPLDATSRVNTLRGPQSLLRLFPPETCSRQQRPVPRLDFSLVFVGAAGIFLDIARLDRLDGRRRSRRSGAM